MTDKAFKLVERFAAAGFLAFAAIVFADNAYDGYTAYSGGWNNPSPVLQRKNEGCLRTQAISAAKSFSPAAEMSKTYLLSTQDVVACKNYAVSDLEDKTTESGVVALVLVGLALTSAQKARRTLKQESAPQPV